MAGRPPGLIVAAPASGSGKTVVTLGLLRALRRAGVAVASFKVGPDYIDAAYHAAASFRPCYNLDPWAMRPAMLAGLLGRMQGGAALIVGEGVMGLFDRVGGPAHAELLRRAVAPLGLPVLGCLPRDAALVLPERHLGLVQAGERPDLDAFLHRAAAP